MKTKVINLYAGPGTGKSMIAGGIFSELKFRGINCEYVQEYAKDKAWEFGKDHDGIPKVFQAQEYIFGKQHFRLRRCAKDVDLIVTDSPILMGLCYMTPDFPIPSLATSVKEAYNMYDNLDVFLVRTMPYEPRGRFQTAEEAVEKDIEIKKLLEDQKLPYHVVDCNREAINKIIDLL